MFCVSHSMFCVSHSMFSVTHNMSKRKTVPVHQLLGFSHGLIFFFGGCLNIFWVEELYCLSILLFLWFIMIFTLNVGIFKRVVFCVDIFWGGKWFLLPLGWGAFLISRYRKRAMNFKTGIYRELFCLLLLSFKYSIFKLFVWVVSSPSRRIITSCI